MEQRKKINEAEKGEIYTMRVNYIVGFATGLICGISIMNLISMLAKVIN